MFGKLIVLFVAVPIVELFLLLKIAEMTSALTTVAIIFCTGTLGAYLAKKEGKSVITDIKMATNEGRVPGDGLINGLCILIGGALLITPGILTDIVGFSLVVPLTRKLIAAMIKDAIKSKIESGANIHFRVF